MVPKGTKQRERKRIRKIIRKQQKKIAEEEGKGKEEENATLHRSSAPDIIDSKPNPSLNHSPLVPAPVDKRETRVKRKERIV